MGFQNSINSALGAAGAAAALGRHMKNQKEALVNQEKELEVKKIDAEKELNIAQNELEKNNFDISTKMETDKDLTEDQRKELKGLEAGKDIDRYLEMKSDKALSAAADASSDFKSELDKYNSGEQKSFPSSKRLKMMKQALQERNDEITARKTLQANVELQKKKLEVLKGVK